MKNLNMNLRDLTPSISDNNVYYNLHLRVEFHLYKKTPKTKKKNPNLILNNIPSQKNSDLSQYYDRTLSELVKKNYINQDLEQK